MTDSARSVSPPARILLATDLSARCDRALERALSLATGWQARLTILHVFEGHWDPAVRSAGHLLPSWQRPPDTAALAKERIRRALLSEIGQALESAAVLVQEGEPAEIIGRVADAESADLIVTGIAREEPFAREPVIMGRTVERLLRRSSVPVLVVRNRARGPYAHALVATDFSEISAQAARTASDFFPLLSLRLLHAFEAPHSGHATDPARYEESFGRGLEGQMQAFVASIALPEEQRRGVATLIERGRPAVLVRQYVFDHGADLVVLGTHGRSALLEAVIGSTAKSILASLPCDALVVRGSRPGRRSED